MKIGIDARMFGPGHGLGRYVEQLIKHLEKIDRTNDYVVFMKNDAWDLWEPKYDNFKKVKADIHWYTFKEQLKLSSIIKKEKLDLMHFPHWNVPIFFDDPFIVTIHDLTMFHFARPESSTRSKLIFWIKDKVHRRVVRRVVKRALHIITTSDFTKRDVALTLGVPMDKMTTVYQSPFFEDGWGDIDKGVLKKHGITKDYVLYVGSAYPHKNLETLLKAWQIFESKYGDDYELVLAGKKNYFYERLLKGVDFKKCRNITFIDFPDDKELASLYSWASLYVFPSLYEGYGLPPLEAMSHDIPVVSSNESCLPEVLGEAALFFDPRNPENMCSVIRNALTNVDIAMSLTQNGRDRIKELSSKKFALETLELYKKYVR